MQVEPEAPPNAEPSQDAIVATRIGPIATRRFGSQGPCLVLWHSLFLDGRSWDPILPRLRVGRTVVVIDGPCHGASPGPERRFSLDECAEAAVEVLDHFDVKQTHWVGNAWGGHVGIVLAAKYPQRIARLAALSSLMQALRPLERLRAGALVAIFRLTGWRPWLANAVVSALVLPSATEETKHYVRDAAQRPGAERTRIAMRSVMFGRPSLVDRLAAVEAPTLFVTSPHDPIWLPDLARAQAAHLRKGRVEIIDGARHVPPLEAPEATAKLLLAWLDATD